MTEEELHALIEKDPTAALCHILKEAGVTMTLYGKPVEEAELRARCLESATKRIADAMIAGTTKSGDND